MRFLFKTSYAQDVRLFQHGGQVFWYGLLAVVTLLAPLVLSDYLVGEAAFVFILAIAGVGLMLLTGFTGLVSLGHAAFLGIGAYAEAYFLSKGVPFPISLMLAALIAGGTGFLIGLPTLRLSGVYLAIATFGFALIVSEILAKWESVTRGFNGFRVPRIVLFGETLRQDWHLYYISLAVLVLVIVAVLNLLRSPTGRAFIAIRDSEVAAQSLGVNLTVYKTSAFAISAAITGLAGALYAHKLNFLSPDGFNIILSIQLLLMIVVGGLGSLHGAVYGAIFVGALPSAIGILRGELPRAIAEQPGLEPLIFGLILVLTVIFEPYGIYGRWLKLKLYFQLFPLYRRAMFKRRKAFLKSGRK
jgi:branched-chain amino acid transport system permease protein